MMCILCQSSTRALQIVAGHLGQFSLTVGRKSLTEKLALCYLHPIKVVWAAAQNYVISTNILVPLILKNPYASFHIKNF